MTKKERDIQKALGLVARYHANVQVGSWIWGNFEAVSEEDALKQFMETLTERDIERGTKYGFKVFKL